MFKFNSRAYRLILTLQRVKYGKNLVVRGCPFIYAFSGSSISLGDNVVMNSNFWSNLIGNYQKCILVARGGCIEIGNNVGMSSCTLYSWKKIVIGDGTIIGANTKIVDSDFHSVFSNERSENDLSSVKTAEVIIGNNCFVGMNSIILKGCVLGDDCVVGAGSVVRAGQYPNGSIIYGNPARIIRRIID